MITLEHILALGARAVLPQRRRHLPQPQERHRAADVHRADAAGGEHQLRRVLALSSAILHGQVFVFFILTVAAAEVGDRPGDPGHAVPQPAHDQRRRNSIRLKG